MKHLGTCALDYFSWLILVILSSVYLIRNRFSYCPIFVFIRTQNHKMYSPGLALEYYTEHFLSYACGHKLLPSSFHLP